MQAAASATLLEHGLHPDRWTAGRRAGELQGGGRVHVLRDRVLGIGKVDERPFPQPLGPDADTQLELSVPLPRQGVLGQALETHLQGAVHVQDGRVFLLTSPDTRAGLVAPRPEPPAFPCDGYGRGYLARVFPRAVIEPAEQGEVKLLLGLPVRPQDGDRLEAARVGVPRLRTGGLPGLSQVAVAVAVHVQRVPVQDQPNSVVSLGAEHEQAVTGVLGLVRRLLEDRPLDLPQVGRRRLARQRQSQTAECESDGPDEHAISSSTANGKAYLPGSLLRLHAARNQNAVPVKLSD